MTVISSSKLIREQYTGRTYYVYMNFQLKRKF